MTAHEINAPADVVEATVMALIKIHNDKAQQAKERSCLQGWFVGQTMKKLNGAVSRPEVQAAVFKALQ